MVPANGGDCVLVHNLLHTIYPPSPSPRACMYHLFEYGAGVQDSIPHRDKRTSPMEKMCRWCKSATPHTHDMDVYARLRVPFCVATLCVSECVRHSVAHVMGLGLPDCRCLQIRTYVFCYSIVTTISWNCNHIRRNILCCSQRHVLTENWTASYHCIGRSFWNFKLFQGPRGFRYHECSNNKK